MPPPRFPRSHVRMRITFHLGLFQAVFSGPPRPAAIKRHRLKQRSVTVVLLGCFIGHSAGANRDGPKFSLRGLGTAIGLGDIGTHVSLGDRLVPKRPEARMEGGGQDACAGSVFTYTRRSSEAEPI